MHRIWRAFGLQPHRQRHFKFSTDPFFVEKVRDIIGLCLDPPDKAMVLCVDEKTRYKHSTALNQCYLWGWVDVAHTKQIRIPGSKEVACPALYVPPAIQFPVSRLQVIGKSIQISDSQGVHGSLSPCHQA